MKFDPWTFLFQIINFVVLLFILKRLLFRPIREIMEKRRRTINDALSEANNKKQEAEKLIEELRQELRAQKKARQQAEAGMRAEVSEERKNLMEAARKEAGKITEKDRAVFEIEKKKFEDSLRVKAVEAASRYAANVLKDVCDEELQRSIVRRFHNEVKDIASDMSGILHSGNAITLRVSTAYPLGKDEADRLRTAFETGLGKNISCSFDPDPALIAGISVRADDKVYDFSIRGQIQNLTTRLGVQDSRS